MHFIRPWLAIGSYRETRDPSLLGINKIGALLHLESDIRHPGIQTLYIPIDDGTTVAPALFRQGAAFGGAQHAAGRIVLVACAAGISRSSSFAIAALREIEGLDLLAAYRAIHQRHREALPHHLLWESLCACYGEA